MTSTTKQLESKGLFKWLGKNKAEKRLSLMSPVTRLSCFRATAKLYINFFANRAQEFRPFSSIYTLQLDQTTFSFLKYKKFLALRDRKCTGNTIRSTWSLDTYTPVWHSRKTASLKTCSNRRFPPLPSSYFALSTPINRARLLPNYCFELVHENAQ